MTSELTPEERAEYELALQRKGKDCICGDCLERAMNKK